MDFNKYADEIKLALDWSTLNQKGRHSLSTMDLDELFCGRNTLCGKFLRERLLVMVERAGKGRPASKYVINLKGLQELHDEFYGTAVQLIPLDEMHPVQADLFKSAEQLKQEELQRLIAKRNQLAVELVQETGLTPDVINMATSLMPELLNSKVKHLANTEHGMKLLESDNDNDS